MDVQVLIVGGGVHGVGLMHDLASRRVQGVHLVEENLLASGTSSRSTKLVHGGFRYLEHLGQWSLVHEALKERATLLRLLRGVVQPLPFVLPTFKGGRPAWMLRAGLFLYDLMAGDGGLPASRALSSQELLRYAPYIKPELLDTHIEKAFLYYDAQMLDDVIVRVAAEAAKRLGATYSEHTQVTQVRPRSDGGFNVTLKNANQEEFTLSTAILVNAAGAWCNANLLRWGFTPRYATLLNAGSHMVLSSTAVAGHKPSDCAAAFLQNDDGRAVFFIPWNGRWLLGTTESILPNPGELRLLQASESDKNYLLSVVRNFLTVTNPEQHIEEVFTGVRTMPLAPPKLSAAGVDEAWRQDPFASPFYVRALDKNISALSRETIIDELWPGLFSIYGGKYTTYRAQSEKLGGLLSRRLRVGATSGTQDKANWFIEDLIAEKPEIFASSSALRQL